jgi:hypothetical protein
MLLCPKLAVEKNLLDLRKDNLTTWQSWNTHLPNILSRSGCWNARYLRSKVHSAPLRTFLFISSCPPASLNQIHPSLAPDQPCEGSPLLISPETSGQTTAEDILVRRRHASLSPAVFPFLSFLSTVGHTNTASSLPQTLRQLTSTICRFWSLVRFMPPTAPRVEDPPVEMMICCTTWAPYDDHSDLPRDELEPGSV